jgi:alkylated DNA repair dioxygenase AlkB
MNTVELGDDAVLHYDEAFLPADLATHYFESIRPICQWSQQRAPFGHLQPRLTASYGDEGLTYRYSGTTNIALPWFPPLLELKERIEKVQGTYNYCLLNLYRDGRDSVGWHADDERGMGDTIASLSLGETRTFEIRHNETKQKMSFPVKNGTLVIMTGTMQRFWKHRVPRTTEEVGERINLTYRRMTG